MPGAGPSSSRPKSNSTKLYRLAWCTTAVVMLASAPTRSAAFAEGSISDRDYRLQYDGYSSTRAFCIAFRQQCQDCACFSSRRLANNLGWRYQLDCVTSQSASPIQAFCGGRQRDESGSAYGPTYDFTTYVCPNTSGCSVAGQPTSPERMYGNGPGSGGGATTSSATAAAPVATNDAQASGEGDGEENPEPNGSYRDHDDESVHMSDSPSTATQAAAAPAGPVTRTVRGSFATPTARVKSAANSNSIKVSKTTIGLASFSLGFAGFIALAVL
ncbi:hypothetical protein ACM66B_004422 [Microbotryomycetes sp. NB124-2]